MERVHVTDLGRIAYPDAWALQQSVFDHVVGAKLQRRAAGVPHRDGRHHLLFCEHDPVFTLGRNGDEVHLLASEEALRERGAAFVRINRGGERFGRFGRGSLRDEFALFVGRHDDIEGFPGVDSGRGEQNRQVLVSTRAVLVSRRLSSRQLRLDARAVVGPQSPVVENRLQVVHVPLVRVSELLVVQP